MDNLLLQLAVAALGQFAGGGPSQLPFNIPVLRSPVGRQGGVVYPTRSSPAPNLQLATLATATCLLRSGAIEREGAIALLERQGQTWGWSRNWGQRIPLDRVDQTIQSAGGCRALVQRVREVSPHQPVIIPATLRDVRGRPRQDWGSRSEREGFGLTPYR